MIVLMIFYLNICQVLPYILSLHKYCLSVNEFELYNEYIYIYVYSCINYFDLKRIISCIKCNEKKKKKNCVRQCKKIIASSVETCELQWILTLANSAIINWSSVTVIALCWVGEEGELILTPGSFHLPRQTGHTQENGTYEQKAGYDRAVSPQSSEMSEISMERWGLQKNLKGCLTISPDRGKRGQGIRVAAEAKPVLDLPTCEINRLSAEHPERQPLWLPGCVWRRLAFRKHIWNKRFKRVRNWRLTGQGW